MVLILCCHIRLKNSISSIKTGYIAHIKEKTLAIITCSINRFANLFIKTYF